MQHHRKDYNERVAVARKAYGKVSEWTTGMCPNCGSEPKSGLLPCSECGCTETVIVYIRDIRYLQKMIRDYDAFICACYGERTRPADEEWGAVVAAYYGVTPPSLFERMSWQDRKAFDTAIKSAELSDVLAKHDRNIMTKYAALLAPVML